MNIQKISFKSNYILPKITSKKAMNYLEKNFLFTSMYLTDNTKKKRCVFSKNGLILKIINKYNKGFENIADFYNIKYIKK